MADVPDVITQCEKGWPGIASLWRSIGLLPRQYAEWRKKALKVIWKVQSVVSKWTQKETFGILFLDQEESSIWIEEMRLKRKDRKNRFLRIEGPVAIHLNKEQAEQLGYVLLEYARAGTIKDYKAS